MKCVSCQREMKSSRCACGGAWVTDASLVDMTQDMRGRLVELSWQHRDGEHRPCPTCGTAMQTVTLVGIALDRCAPHGVWFDANELQAVLQRAPQMPEPGAISPSPKPVHAMSARNDEASDSSTSSSSSGSSAFAAVGAVFEVLLAVLEIATDD
jgi:Zn-finger nucleic acid-binding protein